MKIIATIGVGMLLATGIAAAAPAEAQRWGWNDGYRHGRGWDRGWDRRGRGWDRGWDRRGRGWDRGWDRRWRGDRGWRGGRGFYGRPRTVCRWVDGFYGPQQRCFRVR